MTSMLPEDADFSLRTDKSAPRFEDHPFYQYLDLLVAHLDARMLTDYAILGVYEAVVVKTDGGAKDKAKIKVLGAHGRRALHMCLDVQIKSEREDSGGSVKQPAADGDAAASAAMFQRLLGLRADGAGQGGTYQHTACMRCSRARQRPSSKTGLSSKTSLTGSRTSSTRSMPRTTW